MSTFSWEEELNDAQRAAVAHTDGPLLVIAGAGSGKTRTLTHRVARLVAEGVPPAAILLLTFTRRASQEMLQRATRLLDSRCEHVAGGTFHSFANLKLRQHGSAMGLPADFAILDRADAEDLIGLLRKEAADLPKDRSLPRKNTLADIFSRAVNKAMPIEEVVDNDYPHFMDQLEPSPPCRRPTPAASGTITSWTTTICWCAFSGCCRSSRTCAAASPPPTAT